MIEILPQHVANQIAAGEVVQRPASIVKELLENSIDAGAMSITLVTKDGGQTLIQVIDNGKGMSPDDALKAFMRHATSKIRTADDLFKLSTFGFRGEALASISSVSEIEMKTCRAQDPVGIQVNITGGSEPTTRPVATAQGTNLAVRNLFFNTPARRKFLASVSSENRQIVAEFERVALVNPDVEFRLHIDDKPVLHLAPGNLHERIVALTTKTLGTRLLTIESKTDFAHISGYVATPAGARKKYGDQQYFFVNGRFMRNPYLQKAIVSGFGKLLTPDQYPAFYIYIEVDPAKLDVNIHPTKSEVKFEDEHAIWQVLSSVVRQTLGRHNIVPSMDFDTPTMVEIPIFSGRQEPTSMPPAASGSPDYNPFSDYHTSAWDAPQVGNALGSHGHVEEHPYERSSHGSVGHIWDVDPQRAPFMESIPDYLKFDKTEPTQQQQPQQQPQPQPQPQQQQQRELPIEIDPSYNALQWGGRYIITTTVDGILVIDYPRAMQRIAYERLLANDHLSAHSMPQLHPEPIELSRADHQLITDSDDELSALGFQIQTIAGTTIALTQIPAELVGKVSPDEAIEALLEGLNNPDKTSRRRQLAHLTTRNIARTTPRILNPSQISQLVTALMVTDEPSLTPDQLTIIEIINPKYLFKR